MSGHTYQPFLLRSEITVEEEVERLEEPVVGGSEGKKYLWILQDQWPLELTEAVVASTRLS